MYESTNVYVDCKELIGEGYQDVYMLQATMTTDADADADYEHAHAQHHERALGVTPPAAIPTTTTTKLKDLQYKSSI